jgi:tetratricopeptide (TPR) repeat protein
MRLGAGLSLLPLIILTSIASAYAQSPREQLRQLSAQLQKTPDDNALREKIIKLAASIKPAPAIPEEAREPFVMGATVLKKASGPAEAGRAVDLFTQALNIAPWFADAQYNRAIAREAAGQYESAIDDLKLYLGFKLTDKDRREVQDKIYALKADAQLASVKKAERDKIASVEEAKRQGEQAKRDVITQIKNVVGNRSYDGVILSSSQDSPWAGVNQNELSGGGTYYTYEYGDAGIIHSWKFFDDRVELWGTNKGMQFCRVRGESWGPKVTDMRWFEPCDSSIQAWGNFGLQNLRLHITQPVTIRGRPLSDSEFDPNRRYTYYRFSPLQ